MIDKHSRKISYLRVSVTDLCNLRCVYCMPPGGSELSERDEILSFEEILRIIKHGVTLGVNKIRLTGGEPLVRRGITTLIKQITDIDGINDIALTTNGVNLKEYAGTLKKSGLSRLNISLDTLRPDRFADITRGGNVQDVFDGVEEVLKVGFTGTKMNAVIMRGQNDDEILDFVRYILERNIELRFIELMASGWKNMVDADRFMPSSEIKERVQEIGELVPVNERVGGGPATIYRMKGALGTIGFISAVSKPFCSTCNRLRLTSDGKLRSCLLSGGEVDVRGLLRSSHLDEEELANELTKAFKKVTTMKPIVHSGKNKAVMNQIGG
ncbi:molybdenum cofactor biosynthesis protein A [Candidatus Scalindua japonica]|uniref:GTP 3',8-cyclase n=1 Tax=Candidatus Scalindua japonica TaxID=1284222 RepID=A0A286TUC9_9BACT|nr:GTP 3',8-cyclase MoaA [Candidatus Scalindua japonica]GAX59464.1 molybdenum cofactor biosynthesis protein A [Candidatus Scalindua japonica]